MRPELFLPRPNVDSVLVSIERHRQAPVTAPYPVLSRLVRTGFGQRRKMLRRSLAREVPIEVLEAAGIEPTARAEELDLAAWAALADQVVASASGPDWSSSEEPVS